MQTYVDVAFDGVAEILRMHKKEKLQSGSKKSDYIPPIIHVFTNASLLKFFCKLPESTKEKKNGSLKIESDKLALFDSVYFQIPTFNTLKAMYKELNINKFSHVGSVNDFALIAEKEK